MGNYAKLEGILTISPTVAVIHRSELTKFLPAVHAPWRLSDDASQLLPPLEEVRQPYERGLQQLIAAYLEPRGYLVEGIIRWNGEEPGDTGTLCVTANQLEVLPDEEEPLGEAGIQQILALFSSRKPNALSEAASIIDYFSQPIPGALEALLPHLNDPVMEVRWRTAECLMLLGEEAVPAVPALITALNDPHEWVRSAAAAALGAIGPKATAAIPALEQLRHDPFYGPRGRGQEALERIRVSQTTQ